MQVRESGIILTTGEEVCWEEIKTLRLVNAKLTLVLTKGEIDIPRLSRDLIDAIFRAYEKHLYAAKKDLVKH